jgi:ABC-type sugar transport system substrate-binding protein
MTKSFFSLLFSSGWIAAVALVGGAKSDDLSFGLINGRSAFFEPVLEGWEQKCKDLGATCHSRVPGNGTCASTRIDIVREFISMNIKGIAMEPCGDVNLLKPIIQEAFEAGVPIVTFDADVPNSIRAAYIGTDNAFLGRTLARLLRQLRPDGGTYAIVSPKADRLESFTKEIMRCNGRDDRPHWNEVERNFSLEGIESDFMEQMDSYALLNPSAVITMTQTPMRHPNWTDFVDANRHRNITYIGTDAADYQLSYLNRRYVDGLVGQLPYEMGSVSLQVLYDLATKGTQTLEKTVFSTNIVSYNLIPLELPPLDVDQNILGDLKYFGFTCFGLVALSAVGCMAWTLYHSACSVVRAAQPFFLVMVAGGVLVVASSLVPLSFDDGGESFDDDGNSESMSTWRGVGICMSTPWLAFTGFTVTFSALFSKTWRVNRLLHAKVRHGRIQVSERDVLAPFAVLLTSNIVVLTCWTILDPLTYVRQENDGTDYWNRVISTYGACRSDNVVAYLVPLAVINLSVVATACWQAWQARAIESEFSEAKYIGLTVASLFQAFLTGIPVVVVVREMPKAYYLLLSIVIFLLCMVVLLLIFLPKIFMQRAYARVSEAEQRRMVGNVIRRSSAVCASSRMYEDGSAFAGTSENFQVGGTSEIYPVGASRSSIPKSSSLVSVGKPRELTLKSPGRPDTAESVEKSFPTAESTDMRFSGSEDAKKGLELSEIAGDSLTALSVSSKDGDAGLAS